MLKRSTERTEPGRTNVSLSQVLRGAEAYICSLQGGEPQHASLHFSQDQRLVMIQPKSSFVGSRRSRIAPSFRAGKPSRSASSA